MALVEVTIEGGVALVRLNRPEKRNALSGEMMDGLLATLAELHDNDQIKCVVTVGTGNTYCSGMDLNYLKTISGDLPAWDRPPKLNQLLTAIRDHPKVTVACINGYCLGGGLVLLNCHDLAVASEDAAIGMPEIIRGSFGQLATASLFHAGIPMKKAFWIQLTGRNLTGREAEQLGLVSKAVPAAELMTYTMELAHEIADHDAAALTHGKIAAYFGTELDFYQAIRIDHLVGERMAKVSNPYSDLRGYLRSQKGGTDPTYRKPE